MLHGEWIILIWGISFHYYNILYHYYDNSELTSDSGVTSPDVSQLDDVNDAEEKDRKHTTCIVSSNDPPLENTQGN